MALASKVPVPYARKSPMITVIIYLHIRDSLYVPSAPMCLLSPQTIVQQTCNLLDGFHAKGSHGFFTFAGFHKTIHYNSKNNLPIFFTSSDLSHPPSSSYTSSSESHTSCLCSEDNNLHDNLTPLQTNCY